MKINLLNISSSAEADFILKAWWNRPGKILSLKDKYKDKDSADRINRLAMAAAIRKIDAVKIHSFFMQNQSSSNAISLSLGS